MTVSGVLIAILREFMHPDALPFILGMLLLGFFAFFWRRGEHTPTQRRFVLASLLLWLCLPASVVAGALFHFSGPSHLRGVEFNEPAAIFVASLLVVAFVGSLLLLLFAKGARSNVTASAIPLVFAQFWVGLVAGCAIVGQCV